MDADLRYQYVRFNMITKDNIEALIKFGGLLVYEVSWFDPILWKINIDIRTFNEDHAKKRFSLMEKIGREVRIVSYIVSFDNESK